MPLRPFMRPALAAMLALTAFAAPAQTATAPALKNILTPHRAVYDIGLARAEQGSGVSSAEGRMVFEVTGDACKGYSMRQRMVVNIGDEEGNVGVLDFRVTTFESGDGDTYTFESKTTMNKEVVEAVAGAAHRQGSAVTVSLTQPTARTVTLTGDVLFPSQHLEAIIQAALANRTFLAAETYEGAGTGDSTDNASAAIGRALPSPTDAPLRTGITNWPVSVGYFDPGKPIENGLGEETPSYQLSFTLFENGVTNNLVMDYGNYALSGSLKQIEPLARSINCDSN